MVNQNEGQETPEEIARKHVNVESLKLARKYHKMITSEEKELFKYKMGQKTKKTLIYTGIAAGVALAFYLTGLGINQLSGKKYKANYEQCDSALVECQSQNTQYTQKISALEDSLRNAKGLVVYDPSLCNDSVSAYAQAKTLREQSKLAAAEYKSAAACTTQYVPVPAKPKDSGKPKPKVTPDEGIETEDPDEKIIDMKAGSLNAAKALLNKGN